MKDLTATLVGGLLYLVGAVFVVLILIPLLLWLGGFAQVCTETPPLYSSTGELLLGGGRDCK